MNNKMTEIELINHYRNLDVQEHIVELMQYDIETYIFPEMQVEMFMAVLQKSSLTYEVFNILLDFCFDVENQLVLSSVAGLTSRWERLRISTAYKALLQVKSDNELVSIFRDEAILHSRINE